MAQGPELPLTKGYTPAEKMAAPRFVPQSPKWKKGNRFRKKKMSFLSPLLFFVTFRIAAREGAIIENVKARAALRTVKTLVHCQDRTAFPSCKSIKQLRLVQYALAVPTHHHGSGPSTYPHN